jgi:hypothetical protein
MTLAFLLIIYYNFFLYFCENLETTSVFASNKLTKMHIVPGFVVILIGVCINTAAASEGTFLNFDIDQSVDESSCIHTIIFSKDRASQLHLLFRTMDVYYPEWNSQPSTIIIVASDKEMENGYHLLQRMYKDKIFYWQQNESGEVEKIRLSIDRVLRSSNCELVHLQTDDYVFLNPITNAQIRGKFIKYGKALKTLDFDLHAGYSNHRPHTLADLYWKPENEKFDWNFQGGVYSTVWRRLDILHILRRSNFPSVNWFEQALHYYSIEYREKVQSTKSDFRRIHSVFESPISLQVDVNIAKSQQNHDTLDDFRNYDIKKSNKSLKTMNANFLNGLQLNIDLNKCKKYSFITRCNTTSALFFEPFSPREQKVLRTLQQRMKTNEYNGFETYVQDHFVLDFLPPDGHIKPV